MKKYFFLFLLTAFSCVKPPEKLIKLKGIAFGTSFNIHYKDRLKRNFKNDFEHIFEKMNQSVSTYHPKSKISKINQGDTNILIDTILKVVFKKSLKIYEETDGFFDPSVGVLVNAWGFGPKKKYQKLDSSKIGKLLNFVGFKDNFIKNNKIYKKHPQTYLDFNGIAKGYGVDLVGGFLEQKKIKNYMVEIGGEIRARGKNAKNTFWKIGIEKPHFDGKRSLQKIITLKNESMATSGNYRKYEIDSITGEKYVHTINPKTGWTAKNKILSASVITKKDCADADAYATALMSMGFEKAKVFIKKNPQLKIFLIYTDKKGTFKEYTNF